MSVTPAKTVRELALEFPHATRVFEKLGIDYCCGGNKSLEEACASANLSTSEVLETLSAKNAGLVPDQAERNWQEASMADLAAYIVDKHHRYTREEIARLAPLFAKVCSVHGKNHPELFRMQATFRALAEELTLHMMKEERILFPYVVNMEEAFLQSGRVLPAPFGTVQNPVAMMIHEHDAAGEALRNLRQASAGYSPPQDACVSFQTLYRALAEFETDLHRHIHLENNILFPRAIEMEKGR